MHDHSGVDSEVLERWEAQAQYDVGVLILSYLTRATRHLMTRGLLDRIASSSSGTVTFAQQRRWRLPHDDSPEHVGGG